MKALHIKCDECCCWCCYYRCITDVYEVKAVFILALLDLLSLSFPSHPRNSSGCSMTEATSTGEFVLEQTLHASSPLYWVQVSLGGVWRLFHTALTCATRYPMAMGTLADLEDQEPIPGKENPIKIHLQVGLLQWRGSLPTRLSKPCLNISSYPLQYIILTLVQCFFFLGCNAVCQLVLSRYSQRKAFTLSYRLLVSSSPIATQCQVYSGCIEGPEGKF